MVDQKGLDLIAQIAHELPQTGARFVILGTGEPRYEEMWRALARAYPDRIGVKIGFDEPLSHVLEAGSDLFMMPSRFEPCGLNQMYSLRYGTLPVVRATGGLDDTVENYDPYTGPRHRLQVLGGVGPRVAEHDAMGAPGLRESRSLAAAAARGDARRLVLGAFGPRIRGAVCDGGEGAGG